MATPMATEDTTWGADAMDAIEKLAQTGRRFDVNDLRQMIRTAPKHNMYGAAFRKAKTRGLIVEVGGSRAHARASHGRRVVAWAGVPVPHQQAFPLGLVA